MEKFIGSKEFISFCHSAFDNIPIAIDFLDKDGRMIYINKAFSDFLKIPIEDMIGKIVTEINPTSKFLWALNKKKADIAVRHVFPNDREAICHRIPIFDNQGNLMGGLGMILFEKVNEMKEILKKCEILDKKLKLYKKEIARLNRAKYTLSDIIGDSKPMKLCKRTVKKIANLNLNVLITGESGVGKELFAQAIHNESDRAHMPFVSINTSAIPENLLESELFGYEGGSFTGAKAEGNIGKFEIANGGTIFLDEIADMPYYMQAKILRVIQEREITRIGDNKPIPIDVKIISATHKNLENKIAEKKFREDLYYRLNVLNLQIPPLRERAGDIPKLAEDFLIAFHKEYGLYRKLSKDAMEILMKYSWPGNVRELRNVLGKASVNAEDTIITDKDLPANLFIDLIVKGNQGESGFYNILKKVEKELIEKALVQSNNNKAEAARILEIPRMTLYRKIEDLKINI
ncbi:sigma-54 interaction domain-containing protein [Crassaminicella profunda]|uniref:sigma-54 interaction domain-containing protein n=1 Tax=Crassaminicella profunda TaxID=1286698 RepID=UPI001CA7495F|nr:sigma 54-interacting transcriptional regulator [Crassaminicella profunda]QZY54390.1 sigma 54-interacting transcriptional regulator [Crassaminicella profunda]